MKRLGAVRRGLDRQVPTFCQVARCSARCVMTHRDLKVRDSRRRTDGVPADLSLSNARLYVSIVPLGNVLCLIAIYHSPSNFPLIDLLLRDRVWHTDCMSKAGVLIGILQS